MSPCRKLRIALVGGGIGGLAAAVALSRKGFEPYVFEQASERREVGAGIGISPNAFKVLRMAISPSTTRKEIVDGGRSASR